MAQQPLQPKVGKPDFQSIRLSELKEEQLADLQGILEYFGADIDLSEESNLSFLYTFYASEKLKGKNANRQALEKIEAIVMSASSHGLKDFSSGRGRQQANLPAESRSNLAGILKEKAAVDKLDSQPSFSLKKRLSNSFFSAQKAKMLIKSYNLGLIKDHEKVSKAILAAFKLYLDERKMSKAYDFFWDATGKLKSQKIKNEVFAQAGKIMLGMEMRPSFDNAFFIKRLAKELSRANPDLSILLYEKAGDAFAHSASVVHIDYWPFQQSAESYESAAFLAKKANPQKAVELYGKAGEILASIRNWKGAENAYAQAAKILNSMRPEDPGQAHSLVQKQLCCSVLAGSADLQKLKENGASDRLCAAATSISEFQQKAAIFPQDFAELEEMLAILRSIEKEIGINSARLQKAIFLVEIGIRKWQAQKDKAEGLPNCFIFQALAVAKTDEQLHKIAKLVQIKKVRNSRDAKRQIMWYFEDNKYDRQRMEDFFKLIDISEKESKLNDSFLKNLNKLSMLQSIDKEFRLASESLGQFELDAKAIISKFFKSITKNKRIIEAFLAIDDYERTLLKPILQLYSKYANYPELKPLLDLALCASIVGDFHKIKFPTKDTLDLDYLTTAQKVSIRNSMHQLGFLSKKQMQAWIEDLPPIKITNMARTDARKGELEILKEKIASLKSNLEEQIQSQDGEIEKQFSFSHDYLGKIQGLIRLEQKNSPQFIKLKKIERILISAFNLESIIEKNEIEEKEGQVMAYLRNLEQDIKSLFKLAYGLGKEEAENLQAKIYANEMQDFIRRGRGTPLSVEYLKAYESADPLHLINAGNQPEGSGSCLRLDGTPLFLIGLSGYLLNSNIKMIRVENQDGVVVGRSMLKVVKTSSTSPLLEKIITGGTKAALLVEYPYFRKDPTTYGLLSSIRDAILVVAKKKAEAMGLPLLIGFRVPPEPTKKVLITLPPGLSPYEYSDAAGDVVKRGKSVIRNVGFFEPKA